MVVINGSMEPVGICKTMKNERTITTKSKNAAMRIKTVLTAILVNVLIAQIVIDA